MIFVISQSKTNLCTSTDEITFALNAIAQFAVQQALAADRFAHEIMAILACGFALQSYLDLFGRRLKRRALAGTMQSQLLRKIEDGVVGAGMPNCSDGLTSQNESR